MEEAGARGEVRNSEGSCSEGSESLSESSSMRACWDIVSVGVECDGGGFWARRVS